ncbi:hypothetical protein B0I73DRAFT_10375 [Yarrowia lipolytica]|uniref:Uncharacterized protein n=1 Tax=Yarrowia lipolytica TaxID=4952 RepID=A0A371C811_YARLL|nr:hypothetical protein B0I71DRAFT_31671 [Yarrowia lipolytica]RDW41226.1 hypothetical protein B0I73DRAFT_10375 [Yarrowia lipolytica]RDW44646.1 hypothetical protein B0I74DRAFT_44750 [Yarrowia lipolytica]RDW50192.1 hypothetical protein B0I75DRAFT_8534 [Yarrowia lipolytica]
MTRITGGHYGSVSAFVSVSVCFFRVFARSSQSPCGGPKTYKARLDRQYHLALLNITLQVKLNGGGGPHPAILLMPNSESVSQQTNNARPSRECRPKRKDRKQTHHQTKNTGVLRR